MLPKPGLVLTGTREVDEISKFSGWRCFGDTPPAQPTPEVTPAVAPTTPPAPEMPKKPKTSWLLFLAEFRQKNPGLGKETLSAAAKAWKALSSKDRQPFDDKYKQEKQKYDEIMASFTASGQEVPKAKKTPKLRDPYKPKRPINGFLRFAMEYRQKNSALKATEATKAAKHIWDGFSAEQKRVYEAQYEKDKKAYAEAMAEYKSSGREKTWDDKLKALEQAKRALG